MNSEADFFIPGGTLPCDALCYVERQADGELRNALHQAEFCYVLTSRQMGKSSLMVRTANQLRDDGMAVAVADLTALGQNVTPVQWYRGLLTLIGQQLDLEAELEEHWREHADYGPVQRLFSGLRDVALERFSGSVVVFIDEIDAVRSLTFSTDEFFAAIRECYNRRRQDPAFGRLVFCLLGVAAPSDLVRDTRSTPFNIGRRIELEDFHGPEASVLAIGLALGAFGQPPRSREGAKRLLRRVLYWTAGHPYLTQRLCQMLVSEPRASLERVDQICRALFLSPGSAMRDDNLAFVRERLLDKDFDPAEVLELYARVWRGRPVLNDETDRRVALLRLSGVVRVAGRRLQVRNRVYRKAFDPGWVRAHLPGAELRRQQAAYRRGLLRAGSLGLAVVLALGTLAWVAVDQSNRAARMEAEGRQRLIRTLVASGNRLVEEGDFCGSLVWFVSALRLIRPGAPEERLHRLRLGGVLARCPELQFFGHQGGGLREVSFTPDDQRLLTTSDNGTAQVWDLSARQRGTLVRQPGWIWSGAFSPDGQKIVTAGGRETRAGRIGYARVWAARSGGPLTGWLPHQSSVTHARFSPDGRWVLTASENGSARIWDARSGHSAFVPLLPGGRVLQASFSPDGRRVMTATDQGSCQVWDPTTGRPVGRTIRHRHAVVTATFSPDGERVATASLDGTAGVWDAHTGLPLIPPIRDGFPVNSIAFSPDGHRGSGLR